METLKVLVVDDEPGMLAGIARSLKNLKIDLPDIQTEVIFSVCTADNGEDALDMIKNDPPEILLLDHKLPGISGLEVLENIASLNVKNKITTIMITAYASLETAVSAIKCGAHDFLAKPFTPAELKETIRKTTRYLIHTRQARKLASERRQMRFQFISVLAHELKSPLSAVEGYLDIMKNKTAGDDPAVYDKMIDRCCTRLEGMRKLIMDLLDLTRIESGRKKRSLETVDVCDVARMAIEGNQAQAHSRNITIEMHAEPVIEMTADRGEIEIIMNNLVSNAVKYNRDGGRVDVTLSAYDGRVKIEVSDTGIGMTKEETDRLFNDFVRIKNAKTRNILGSGLGLSIVRKIVYLYEGEVRVSSRPDEGSTFTVILNQHTETEDVTEASLAEADLQTSIR